jgi:hypothetical protein
LRSSSAIVRTRSPPTFITSHSGRAWSIRAIRDAPSIRWSTDGPRPLPRPV